MRGSFPSIKALYSALLMTALTAPTVFAQQPAPAASSAASSLVERQLGDGLYELALIPGHNKLYVASAQSFKDVNGGVIYRLDPTTLALTGETHTDLKNFGMAIDDKGQFFYTTNSLDGGVSKVDTQTGKVVERLFF